MRRPARRFDVSIGRIGITVALVGLTASLASFLFPSIPAGALSFYFPLAWVAWIASAFAGSPNCAKRLLILWVLVDVSILLMFLSITTTNGDVQNDKGTEIAWLLSYMPVVIPTGIAAAPLAKAIETAVKAKTEWFGPTYCGVVAAWVSISFVAAMQSILIMFVASCFHRRRRAAAA